MTSPSSPHVEPLTVPVERAAVKAFYRDFSRAHPAVRRFSAGRIVAAVVGIICWLVFLLAMTVGVFTELEEGGEPLAGQLGGMAGVTALMTVAGGLFIWMWIRSEARRGTPERHYRLAWFARDNGMDYLPGPAIAAHLTPWAKRGRLIATRILRPRTGPRFVEFANVELRTGTGRYAQTSLGGYAAVRLATKLPHILLDAKGNDSVLSDLVPLPARAQRLSLEGDFDAHYTLYCPEGYERDALYLFTPDVMARLVDIPVRHDHVEVDGRRVTTTARERRGTFDIEIVDDWLIFATPGDMVTLDPDHWVRITGAVHALDDKIAQWERWRDGRLGGDLGDIRHRVLGVAEPGQRLRRGLSRSTWFTIILLGAVAAVWGGVWLLVSALAPGA